MTPWEQFFTVKIEKIFQEKKKILDIGGGLRISKDKNNRYDPSRAWIIPFLAHVTYRIIDPVPDYHPDIVGDIHHLPLPDNSEDALICMAVLEHVESPWRACEEIYRVLQPGGYAFLYVPFLYYYHPERGYYADYWRFTEDGCRLLCKQFQHIEIQSVRGAYGTVVRLTPLGRSKHIEQIAYFLDYWFGKLRSKQVSGYYIFLKK